eukprot:791265-Prymnesium_polylepis.1
MTVISCAIVYIPHVMLSAAESIIHTLAQQMEKYDLPATGITLGHAAHLVFAPATTGSTVLHPPRLMLASLTADRLSHVLKQFDFTTRGRGRFDRDRSEAVRNLTSCGSTCRLLRQLADEMLATWLSVRMSIAKTPIELSESDRDIDFKQLEDLFWAVGTVRLTSHKHTQFIAAGLINQLIAVLREADVLFEDPPVEFEDGRPPRLFVGGVMRPINRESLHGKRERI